MTLTNQDKANLIMGAIFATLLDAWPTRINLSCKAVLSSLFPNFTRDEDRLCLGLLQWLSDEGYIRFESINFSGTCARVVLSEKGLRTLNSVPSGISNEKSYGEKIVEAAKEVASDTAKKTLSDLVGQMIGGVIKSLSAG